MCIRDSNQLGDRNNMKTKYDRVQLVVKGAYAPEEGKQDETEVFYWGLQKLIDKNVNLESLLMSDMKSQFPI